MMDLSKQKFDVNRKKHDISGRCGEVVVGCADVAGVVDKVIKSSDGLRREHQALAKTVAALESDQALVLQASDEARLLSENAMERLGQGLQQIENSLQQVNHLLELVDTLSHHVTGFASAMSQVKRSSRDIEQIAETTNILALNATIEAMRAGEAGRTFAIVAAEVKSLANDTRKATDEIATTVEQLELEANQVIERIEAGSKASFHTKNSVDSIQLTIDSVSGLVSEVDQQNDQIARATATISNHVNAIQNVLENFAKASDSNSAELSVGHRRMGELEMMACEMFDELVHSGQAPDDEPFVEQACAAAVKAQKLAIAAIASGKLSIGELFDRSYRPVPGSNPEIFETDLMGWADENWRPIIEAVKASDDRIISCVVVDVNGHLPTHLSEMSKPQTGNFEYNTLHCRRGRLFATEINKRAGRSTAPYMMSVYRRDDAAADYAVCRSVYAPIRIDNETWGNVQISYRI